MPYYRYSHFFHNYIKLKVFFIIQITNCDLLNVVNFFQCIMFWWNFITRIFVLDISMWFNGGFRCRPIFSSFFLGFIFILTSRRFCSIAYYFWKDIIRMEFTDHHFRCKSVRLMVSLVSCKLDTSTAIFLRLGCLNFYPGRLIIFR